MRDPTIEDVRRYWPTAIVEEAPQRYTHAGVSVVIVDWWVTSHYREDPTQPRIRRGIGQTRQEAIRAALDSVPPIALERIQDGHTGEVW